MKTRTHHLVGIALMAVMIALCSQLVIPSVIPFTMQTFAVFCTLELLGGRHGTYSVLLYLLMGLIGLPVFTAFSGGIGHLLSPTGGYLIGFLCIALCYWGVTGLCDRLSSAAKTKAARSYDTARASVASRRISHVAGLILGLCLCYLFGTLWFTAVYSRDHEAMGFAAALSTCVLPYIIPDGVKMALAMVIAGRVRRALSR